MAFRLFGAKPVSTSEPVSIKLSVDYYPGLGSIPELELMPIPIPGIGIE